ncbi:DMT family transporter [Paraburkholderia sp. EG287A]|uniref:DMT family transporter n=1 Tax=Paraburkholderia sp. EG287A TaxID=3237012 RepID=UPI0034D15307
MSTVEFRPSQRHGRFTIPRTSMLPSFAVLSLLSALAYALRSIVTKQSMPGLPLGLMLLLQSSMCAAMLFALSRGQSVVLAPPRRTYRLYGSRMVWGGLTTLLQFYCLQKMPASLATALSYTAPLFTAVLAPMLLRERSTLAILLTTTVGFGGVALNALPYLDTVQLFYIGVGLLSGFVNAMMQISIRGAAAEGEPGLRGVFWMHAATAAGACCACVFDDTWSLTVEQVLACVVIAVLSVLAQLTNAAAYARGSALPVNALSFLTLPMTVGLTVVLLGEQVSLLVGAGMGITLPAAFTLVWLEQKRRDTILAP